MCADALKPGSDAAIAAGCSCPIIDNCHGAGIWAWDDKQPLFWYAAHCPLHGNAGGLAGDNAIEFDCAGCGRHIISVAGPLSYPPRCALCMAMPGWHQNAELAKLIDPY